MSLTNSVSPFSFVLTFFLLSCNSPKQVGVEEVNAKKLKTLLEEGIELVDVRTPEEYNRGRISGAKLINYRDANFLDQMSKLDKDKPVAIYCAAGGRSTGASKILIDAGFKTIYNYTGGFGDWKNKGEAIEN